MVGQVKKSGMQAGGVGDRQNSASCFQVRLKTEDAAASAVFPSTELGFGLRQTSLIKPAERRRNAIGGPAYMVSACVIFRQRTSCA
jgi:hypothetical protein